MFSGNTILGDGSVILIIDPNGVARGIGMAEAPLRVAEEARNASPPKEEAALESMLVFRAGSPNPKAVPLSLVTRLEMIDAGRIEMSSGHPMVQYRGQLMPLIPVNGEVRIRTSGNQPLLVFSHQGRSMALFVDEIVDIIEGQFEIELASAQPGIIGTSVIKGQATEIIDLAYFLPMAFEDWLGCDAGPARRVLLIDDAAFFRNMLAPVLKAAGFAVTPVASAQDALALLRSGRRFDVVITDIEMPGMDGFELAAAVRANPGSADVPVIGLSTIVSPEAIERGKRVGLHNCVAKFDRQGLIAALKEQTADIVRAA